MGTHFSRIQQDLFHELKKVCVCIRLYYALCICLIIPLFKVYISTSASFFISAVIRRLYARYLFFFIQNGESRSVCVALDCFSSLFSHTRPSKCGTYAQNLVPVLLRLISRQEESVHEGLLEALSKILPTLVPFMSIVNIKVCIALYCV